MDAIGIKVFRRRLIFQRNIETIIICFLQKRRLYQHKILGCLVVGFFSFNTDEQVLGHYLPLSKAKKQNEFPIIELFQIPVLFRILIHCKMTWEPILHKWTK